MRSSLPSSRKACVPNRAVFVQGRRTRLQKQPKEERRKCNAFWGNKAKDDKKNKAVVDPLLKKLKGAVNEIETEEELNEYLARNGEQMTVCLLYTSPSPRDLSTSRMPSSA